MSEQIARQFHDLYERLAPQFGYETRENTRVFDPQSQNGRLMIAVCAEVIGEIKRERDEARAEAAALLKPAEAVEAFCLAHNHANKVEEAICSLSFQLQAADEHRRLAERLAEAAMFERDQLRMRVAKLESGIVVEDTK